LLSQEGIKEKLVKLDPLDPKGQLDPRAILVVPARLVLLDRLVSLVLLGLRVTLVRLGLKVQAVLLVRLGHRVRLVLLGQKGKPVK
jgi:hypothetical protein